MGRILFTISTITLLFISHVRAQNIQLFVEKTEELTSAKFGFRYQAKNNEQIIGSYFDKNISRKKFNAIDLRINGNKQLDRKLITVDGKELLRNKGKLFVSYRNPKIPEIIQYDTLLYSYPKELALMMDELNTLESKALSLNVTFNDGDVKNYQGNELYTFLDKYGFTISVDHAMFEIDYLSETSSLMNRIPSLSNSFSSVNEVRIKTDLSEKFLVENAINVIIEGEEYASVHKLEVNYGGSLEIDFSAKNASYKGLYGANGEHASKVDIVVKLFNDSLYEVSFMENSVAVEGKYLINPEHTKILVTSYGGRGGNGSNGNDGIDGTLFDQTAEVDRGRQVGQNGTDGYRGGTGGNGGNVTVYYEKKFEPYLNLFKIINDGGAGGKGGKGGKGGRLQNLSRDTQTSYYSLGSDRARNGKNGKNGRWGATGKIDYILLD